MRKIFFLAIAFGGIQSAVYAFRPTIDPRTQPLILNEDALITLADPRTHGDVQPRSGGNLGSVSLRWNDESHTWIGETSQGMVTQTWGSPFLVFDSGETMQDIDLVLRQFVEQNLNQFRVRSGELIMDKTRTKISGPYRYITYNRVIRSDGAVYPVEGAFLTFRIKGGRVIQITNFTYGAIKVVDAPQISEEEALQTVVEDSGFQQNTDKVVEKVRVEVQPYLDSKSQTQFRFVYQVSIRKRAPQMLMKYSVNASDGRIARIVNSLHMAGHVGAEVLQRKPGDSVSEVGIPEAFVRSGRQTEKTEMDGSFQMDPAGALAELAGVRALIKLGSSQNISQPIPSDGSLIFPASQYLSENMAYYYVNRVNQFVRQFIKSAPRMTPQGQQDFLNSPMTVNTRVKHAVIKGCNAWFDPEEKTLNFLEEDSKCFASSHYSDVIFHEWGHALDDALGGIQDDAFSEGIGDVISVLMTGDPLLAPGFVKGSDRPIRNIDGIKVYPKDRSRDPHAESLIVSGAWYEFLKSMVKVYGSEEGRKKTAEIFFKHLVSTDSYLDSYMGALAIDDDDGNLQNCTPHMCLMNVAFSKRGIAKADPRCFAGTTSNLPACAPSTLKPSLSSSGGSEGLDFDI